MRSLALRTAPLLVAIAFAGCSSPAATGGPGAGTNPPPAGTQAAEATGPMLAGEACSYLSAEEVGAIVGTVPVLVEERAGRGDCDYFLNAAEDAKVNIGLFEWAAERRIDLRERQGLRRARDRSTSETRPSGSTTRARARWSWSGPAISLISVQAFNTGDLAAQLEQATRLAEAVYNKI